MTEKVRLASILPVDQALVVVVEIEQLRDADLAFELRDLVLDELKKTGAANVVFDLQKVNFIGSVGFLSFLGVRRHLGSGRIILCNLTGPIRQVFALCRLIPTEAGRSAPFEVAGTPEEAIERLATSPVA
ncbi:MAG: STAS domain-containing protein [Planctomycetota bacterium]|nr:STAS domain-containing protein [Planctomycetota bacterium]